MSRYEPDRDQPARLGDLIHDQAAYAHAEQMLDRYGITYIYYHPEILLGIVPGTALAEKFYARQWERDRRTRRHQGRFARCDGPRQMDDLIQDLLEGYGRIQDVFGPESERRYR